MSDLLIVRIGRLPDDPVYWLHQPVNHASTTQGRLNNIHALTELCPLAEHAELIVLVPADTVILRNVHIPGKINTKSLKALPYLLEEQVTSDVEQLHITLLAQEDHNCYLLAVEKKTLQQWLQWFTEAGLSPRYLLPDVLALPVHQDAWSAVMLDNEWLIRQNHWSGIILPQDWLTSLQSHWLIPAPVTSYSPIENPAENWSITNQCDPLQLMAHSLTRPIANLLTGEFKPTTQSGHIRAWLIAGGLALTLFAVSLAKLTFEGYQLQQKTTQVKQQSQELYQQLFPDDKNRTGNPRTKLTKQLQQLQATANKPGFLWMLTTVTPLLDQIPQLEIIALRFDQESEELELGVQAPGFAPLTAVLDTQQTLPIEIELIDEQPINQGVTARLIIRKNYA